VNFVSSHRKDLLEDRKPFDDEPETADGALDGLTLIFTGDLKIHKRDAATKLAERLGAKVLTTPAPTITHAVVGENAAPAKVKKLQKDQIRVLHEAEWLELLKQGRASPLYSPLCWKPGISKMGPVAPGPSGVSAIFFERGPQATWKSLWAKRTALQG
jgi:hypothetical protein